MISKVVESQFKQLRSSPKKRFFGASTEFHSFHGLMNSINWPAPSVLVFKGQLVEHCSANAEATGSNPVEAPKKLFFQATSQLL